MPDESDENTLIADTNRVRELTGEQRVHAFLTVMTGPNVGQMYRLAGESTVGRTERADVVIPDHEISRRHARIRVLEGRVTVEDLGSTNGTFVNGNRVDHQDLKDGDKLQFGTNVVLKFSYQDSLDENFQKQMLESASRDGLTGAYNKSHFVDRLASEFAYSTRHDEPLTLIMFDIDHFKQVNDTHGHLAGDEVLSSIAAIVHENIRAEDVFARYGGEEFVIVSRAIRHQEGVRFAERIRQLVEQQSFVHGDKEIPVTVSVGVASIPDERITNPIALVSAADEALYRAKRSGRNRVEQRAPE